MNKGVNITLKDRIGFYKAGDKVPVSYNTASESINQDKAELTNIKDLPKIKDGLTPGLKSSHTKKLNEVLEAEEARKAATDEVSTD